MERCNSFQIEQLGWSFSGGAWQVPWRWLGKASWGLKSKLLCNMSHHLLTRWFRDITNILSLPFEILGRCPPQKMMHQVINKIQQFLRQTYIVETISWTRQGTGHWNHKPGLGWKCHCAWWQCVWALGTCLCVCVAPFWCRLSWYLPCLWWLAHMTISVLNSPNEVLDLNFPRVKEDTIHGWAKSVLESHIDTWDNPLCRIRKDHANITVQISMSFAQKCHLTPLCGLGPVQSHSCNYVTLCVARHNCPGATGSKSLRLGRMGQGPGG